MANERTYPMLPCRDIDEAITFYEALGFKRTYRQVRPNPSAVVAREDFQIHLFGMDNFKPEDSYGSVIVVVPDPDALYNAFAAGLAQIVLTAARLGDAHGDEGLALKTLEKGIARFSDAPAIDRVRAFLYRAELAMRLNDHALAQSSLAAAQALTLTDEESATIAEELARTAEIVSEHQ